MATYAPIPTGYVDDGPLGALWAGQNAAAQRDQNEMSNLADMMDLLTKGQTYDQTARMDPERLRQLQYTNTGLDLGNQLASRKLPNEGLMSDVQGRFAQEQLNTPGWARGKLAGEMAQSRGIVADTDLKERTLEGVVGRTNTESKDKQMSFAIGLIPTMMSMNPMQRAEFMQRNGVPADIAKVMIDIGNEKGGFERYQNRLSVTPKSIADERLQAQKDAADLKRAGIMAGATIAAAERQAKAAETANDKLAFTSILGTTNSLAAQLKLQIAQANESLQAYKKPEDQDATYREILKSKKDLENRLSEANNLLWTVTTKLGGVPAQRVEQAPPTAVMPSPVTPQTPAVSTSQGPRRSTLGQTYGPLTPEDTILANARAGDPAAIDYLMARDEAAAAKAKAAEDEAIAYRNAQRGGKKSASKTLDSATEADLKKYLQ